MQQTPRGYSTEKVLWVVLTFNNKCSSQVGLALSFPWTWILWIRQCQSQQTSLNIVVNATAISLPLTSTMISWYRLVVQDQFRNAIFSFLLNISGRQLHDALAEQWEADPYAAAGLADSLRSVELAVLAGHPYSNIQINSSLILTISFWILTSFCLQNKCWIFFQEIFPHLQNLYHIYIVQIYESDETKCNRHSKVRKTIDLTR